MGDSVLLLGYKNPHLGIKPLVIGFVGMKSCQHLPVKIRALNIQALC